MQSGDDSAVYQACLATLRDTDFDRYLACLLMPEPQRGAVAALYAFNAELARIRDAVREPVAGEIRLQWWREVIEGDRAREAAASPLAAGLMRAADAFRLPRAPLLAMTEARVFDLYDDPMQDVAMFEGYAGETASALIQLSAMVLDQDQALAAAEAAGHAGIAQLVAGCLLLLPLHRSRHQVFIPGDILAATGLDAATFLAAGATPQSAQAILAFAGYGRDHLARARRAEAASGISGAARLAFLPVALAETVFARAEKAGAAALEQSLRPSQLRRQWQLWRAARRGRF
jgi:phytoene synthase